MKTLTFPVVPILWAEEVVANLVSCDPLDYVHRLQGIHHHTVYLLLSSVHPHLSILSKQLPTLPAFPDAQLGHRYLLSYNTVDLIKCYTNTLSFKLYPIRQNTFTV